MESDKVKQQCPEFPFFGARYPDATCIDGFLWDLDHVGDDGLLYGGGEEPCPFCNTESYIESHWDEYMNEEFDYDEATSDMIHESEEIARQECREHLGRFHKKYGYVN